MNNDALITTFTERFKSAPQGVAIAPGRVNIIGEFTDYNNGFVLPCALTFNTRVYFRRRADKIVRVVSEQYPNEKEQFSLGTKLTSGPCQWGNYVRAVIYILQAKGHILSGVDLLIDSNVPQGSGLSSSAALEVAIGGLFNHVDSLNLSTTELALIGQQAENDFMDCQCGIMDQLVSANGQENQALLIDCQSLDTQSITIPEDLSLVIINSNYPRKLVDSEYNQRRSDCESAAEKMSVLSLRDADLAMLERTKNQLSSNEYKRAHHVISENARVLAAKDALINNDMGTLTSLMAASHTSLKNDFEVTVPATDGLVEICKTALNGRGAVRMTGGGFGGAIICLCRQEDIVNIEMAVAQHYQAKFNLNADVYIAKAGAGLTINLF